MNLQLYNNDGIIISLEVRIDDDGDHFIHPTYEIFYLSNVNIINYSLKLLELNIKSSNLSYIEFIYDIDKLYNVSKLNFSSRDYEDIQIKVEEIKNYVKTISLKYNLQYKGE